MKFSFLAILFILLFYNSEGQSYPEEVSKIAFSFYNNIMSPVKAPSSSCQFYPSCSKFGHQSIERFGMFKGMLLTADRYIRCSSGRNRSGKYPRFGKLLYDPPECNYFFGTSPHWHISSSITNFYGKTGSSEPNTDTSFKFPRYLFLEADFPSSILELKRVKFNSTDDFVKNKSDMLISVNYIMQDNLNEAINLLEEIKTDSSFLREYFILRLTIGDKQNTFLWNRHFIGEQAKSLQDTSVVYFDLYNEFKLENFKECKNIIQQYSENDKFLKNALNNALDNYDKIDTKSPFLAGMMSTVLPGSGYLYTGSVQEAFSSFLINGLLGAGIYSLFHNDNTGSGILLSAVAAPFYFGNIIGSANAAHLYNKKQKDRINYNLRNDLGINYYFSTSFYLDLFSK